MALHQEVDMNHQFYRYGIIAFTALVLGGPSLWIASRPSRPTSRLGMRGKKRQQGLLRSPTWATIEPLVRWMGARVNGVLPLENDTKLDTLLTHAGDYRGMTADELFGWMVASALFVAGVAGAAAALVADVSVALGVLPIAVFVGGAFPYFMVDAMRVERLRTINRNLPNVIDLLALSMSAGLDFPGALHQLVERSKLPEAMRDELEYMLQQLQLGRTRAQVLRELASRAPADSVRELAQAVIQAEERGNPVSAVLEIQATISRTRRSNLAERAANDMKARMVLPTMMLIGVGLMLIALPSAMMMERFSSGLR
jgi:tight adherence protein C